MNNNYIKIIKNHPNLYKYLKGIGCGIGWYNLINNLSSELEQYIKELKLEWDKDEYDYLPYAAEVKSENGHLKFYLSRSVSNGIKDSMENYEKLSGNICEVCGSLGMIRSDYPYKCLCNKCYKKLKETDEKI